MNAKPRNSLACTGHSDCGLKLAEIELFWNGKEKKFWILTYYPLTSTTADVFIWHSGLKLPFRVASWKLLKWFSQSYVTRRFSSVMSASSGGDLMRTGLEPLARLILYLRNFCTNSGSWLWTRYSSFIKYGKFLGKPREYYLLKRDSASFGLLQGAVTRN